MSSRDPLYDPNIRPEGSTLEEQIDSKVADASSGDDSGSSMDNMKQQGQQAAQQAREKGEQAMGQAREKASEVSGQAHQKADEGIGKASSGLSEAADKLRQQGEQQEGQVGEIASTAAGKLDSASGYLRDKDTDQLVTDLEDLVRRKPMESLLAAAGIGLLLSRIFR